MLGLIISGGVMMIPLMTCSIIMVAVLIERGLVFHRLGRMDIASFRREVIELVGQDKLDEAVALCERTPSPVSAVLLVGLRAYQATSMKHLRPDAQMMVIEKAMEDYTPKAIHAVEQRLNWLSTISNVAPLFGMTGTVTGMIRSFGSLGAAGTLDAGVVGAGISEALVATASGLIVALLSLIPYNEMMNRSEKMTLEIEEAASEMAQFIFLREEEIPAE